MRKEKISFEQLTAGALLKFGKVDSVDMTLLMGGIHNTYELINDEYDYINDYFILVNGNVVLNEKYVRRFYQYTNSEILEKMQGNVLKKYMDNLNISEFTLRKIKLLGLGCVVKDALEETFSEIQMGTIVELYEKGFIEDYIQEDARYGDYEAVRITQEGKLHLFKIDNKMVIDDFLNTIRCNGYNDDRFDEFLLEQDLDLNCYKILTSKNYSEFCWKRLKKPKTLDYSRSKKDSKK